MWSFRHVSSVGRPIDVDAPQVTRRGRRFRVTAAVDGRQICFESADLPLAPSSEAFGAALLVPSLHAGRPLRLAGGVCDTWARNLGRLSDEFRESWYPDAQRPLVVPTTTASDAAADQSLSNATALCFSGGVDAFHTLFKAGSQVDVLLFIVGYDVRLHDRQAAVAVASLVRDVAAATSRRGVVIATNLRRHRLVRATPWLRAFGGPLAAGGHLLGPAIGRLLISSDGLGFEHSEVGSRPSADPLHSSACLAVEHVAAGVRRLEKIARIAHEPLVQRHLRACWQRGHGGLNCCRCEKCIRTMLALDACGALGRFTSFGHGRGIVAAIDALPAIDGVVTTFYEELLASGLSGPCAAAVRRLLARSVVPAAGTTPSRPPAPPPPASRGVVPAGGGRGNAARHRLLSPAAFAHVFAPLRDHRVGYVRPEGNIGDQLIEVAMIQLLAEYGIRWRLVTADSAATAGVDLLVFGGGGNMGTRYAGNHALRTQALATGLPVVILPQSFTTREDRPFAKVFVRERGSLAFRPDGIVAPDLALGLATVDPPRASRDLGVFLRRDQERGGRKPLFVRDPVRLHHDPFAYLAMAARYRRIVTDRLHFAVAGLHAGRDVTLVANDYHKNRSMHETWLADLGCRFAADAAAALGRRAA